MKERVMDEFNPIFFLFTFLEPWKERVKLNFIINLLRSIPVLFKKIFTKKNKKSCVW
jgi:hypothetical protein